MAVNVTKCWALYEYNGRNKNEISFERGEVVWIIDIDDITQPEDWYKGYTNNDLTEGYFPRSFVAFEKPDWVNEDDSDDGSDQEEVGEKEEEAATAASVVETTHQQAEEDSSTTTAAAETADIETEEDTVLQDSRKGQPPASRDAYNLRYSYNNNSSSYIDSINDEANRLQNETTNKTPIPHLRTNRAKETVPTVATNDISSSADDPSAVYDVISDYANIRESTETGNAPVYWTMEQVGNWLRSTGLGEFAPVFLTHKIRGDMLFDLDHERLMEMNIKVLDKRIKILNEIAQLDEPDEEYYRSPTDNSKMGASTGKPKSTLPTPPPTTAAKPAKLPVALPTTGSAAHPGQESTNAKKFGKGAGVQVLPPMISADGPLLPSKIKTSTSLNNLLDNNQVTGEPVSPKMARSPIVAEKPKLSLDFSKRPMLPTDPSVLPSAGSSSSVESIHSPPVAHAPEVPQKPPQRTGKLARKTEMPVPDVCAGDIEPEYAGWMTKQGGSYKNWRRRWFILRNHSVYYFKTPKRTSKALGQIYLENYSIELSPEIPKKYSFKAASNEARTYYFYCDTDEDREQWMRILKAACIGDLV